MFPALKFSLRGDFPHVLKTSFPTYSDGIIIVILMVILIIIVIITSSFGERALLL